MSSEVNKQASIPVHFVPPSKPPVTTNRAQFLDERLMEGVGVGLQQSVSLVVANVVSQALSSGINATYTYLRGDQKLKDEKFLMDLSRDNCGGMARNNEKIRDEGLKVLVRVQTDEPHNYFFYRDRYLKCFA